MAILPQLIFFLHFFSWKVKPHLFLKRLNHWHEALKVLAPFSSPSSLTKFRIVILHHKLVTGKRRARLAVILLTSSSCCATKSHFFCFVWICLSFLVDAFLDLVIHFSLSFNHFLKEFHGHWCLSSYFCLSSGLIKFTFSKSQIGISFALNADRHLEHWKKYINTNYISQKHTVDSFFYLYCHVNMPANRL